jgi:hypothetical protein
MSATSEGKDKKTRRSRAPAGPAGARRVMDELLRRGFDAQLSDGLSPQRYARRRRKEARPSRACSAVRAGLALNPAFAVSRARAAWTAMSDDPTYLAQLEPCFQGLRKAGVPEE